MRVMKKTGLFELTIEDNAALHAKSSVTAICYLVLFHRSDWLLFSISRAFASSVTNVV